MFSFWVAVSSTDYFGFFESLFLSKPTDFLPVVPDLGTLLTIFASGVFLALSLLADCLNFFFSEVLIG
jgi:hypothetical protein